MYDIAVVGAGPAGATFARLVGPRYKILLIDKRRFSEPAHSHAPGKCCGGLLAPDAQRMLSVLGLGLPRSVLEEPQLFVVRAIDLPSRSERYYQRHYINIHRQKFDRWLVRMIPDEVDIRLGCRVRACAGGPGGFRLTLEQGARVFTETARILVGADGASSPVRRRFLAQQPSPKLYIAIQEWVEADRPTPWFSSLFDASLTDFYCWTIPKDHCLIVGAALDPRADTAGKFRRLKDRLRRHGFQIGKTLRREGAYLLRPVSAGQESTGCAGVALVGEAGGWISPSSAEGLSYAFRSALLLADSMQESLDGFEARYRSAACRLKRNLRVKRLKSHFIFHPLLRGLVMRSGLRAIEVYGS